MCGLYMGEEGKRLRSTIGGSGQKKSRAQTSHNRLTVQAPRLNVLCSSGAYGDDYQLQHVYAAQRTGGGGGWRVAGGGYSIPSLFMSPVKTYNLLVCVSFGE